MTDPSTGRRKLLTPILVGTLCGVLGMVLLGLAGPLFGFDEPWRAPLGFVLGWLAGYMLTYALQRPAGGNSA